VTLVPGTKRLEVGKNIGIEPNAGLHLRRRFLRPAATADNGGTEHLLGPWRIVRIDAFG